MEPQTTLNTVCHDSIISHLVSLYQMLSSAKPNWFATEMKGWQAAIHHRLHWGVCICVRHLNVSARRAWGPAKWKANNSSRVMRILWWLSGLFMCLHVCDVCAQMWVWKARQATLKTLYVTAPPSACGGSFKLACKKTRRAIFQLELTKRRFTSKWSEAKRRCYRYSLDLNLKKKKGASKDDVINQTSIYLVSLEMFWDLS